MIRDRHPPPDGLWPSLDDITAIAEAALAAIPPVLSAQVKGVAIRVEELCDKETVQDLALPSAFDLLGL